MLPSVETMYAEDPKSHLGKLGFQTTIYLSREYFSSSPVVIRFRLIPKADRIVLLPELNPKNCLNKAIKREASRFKNPTCNSIAAEISSSYS